MKRVFSFFTTLFFLTFFIVSPPQVMGEEKEESSGSSFFKDNLFVFANFSANGVYSKLLNGSAITGGFANGYLAPAVKINDQLFFMVIGNGFYKKSKQVYKEDQGTRLSSEALSYTVTPKLKINLTDAFSVSPSFFYTRFLSKQTTDVEWGYDLYDYYDIGAGIDFSYQIEKTDASIRKANFGVQMYKRTYPNFISLLTLAGLGNLEEKEKDHDGVLVMGDYSSFQDKGLSYKVSGSILFKDFIDKKLENDIGGRDQIAQRDQTYTVALDLSYKPENEFTYSLVSTGVYNQSNQHLAEGTFPAINLRRNYYSYYSLTEKVGVNYTHELENDKAFSLGGTYSISYQRYLGRLAKDVNGLVTGQKEVDINHEFGAKASYKFHENWEAGGSATFQAARSNVKDESTFRYKYELLTVYLGITFNY